MIFDVLNVVLLYTLIGQVPPSVLQWKHMLELLLPCLHFEPLPKSLHVSICVGTYQNLCMCHSESVGMIC
jgi:hypothetical protein